MNLTIEDVPTTSSFVLTAGLVMALRVEAKRRGVSISELVRDLLTAALAEQVPV